MNLKLVRALFAASVLLLALMSAGPAGAGDTPGASAAATTNGEAVMSEDGYLLHDDGTTGATYPGDGSSSGRYNPTGEDIVVARDDIGLYTITVSGTDQSFTPIVTAHTSLGNHCKVGSYAYPGTTIAIRCYDSTGALVDEEFTLRWTTTLEDPTLQVLGDGTGFCCGSNPWGADPSVTKPDIGEYVVSTPGAPNFEAGNVHVTALGEDDVHCKVAAWGSLNSTIMCFDSAGDKADSSFTFLRIGSEDDAHVWANDETSTTSYTPLRQYSHNPQGLDPTAIMNATGSYTVTIPGHLVAYGGSVAVTGFGSTPNKCTVVDWPDATTVNVSCTDSAGAAVDSRFTMLFTRFQVCNGLPANIEIGNNVPTDGDDIIVGTAAADSISALDGDDVICAGDGDDTVVGAGGDDIVFGEGGNDLLSGNAGNDQLDGGDDDDTIFAGSGDDVVAGGDGNDVLGGSSGFDQISGQDGADTITGGSDADGLISGGEGNDAVNGGGGPDNNVTGDNGDDTVSGNGGDDTITGGPGADEVRGGQGDDTVLGGDGDDFIAGNTGTDTCDGEAGTDTAASNCEIVLNVP